MSKTGKVVAVMVAIAVLAASVDLFRRHRRAQAAQAKRDTFYAKVLEGYRLDLQPGMTRSQIKKYLESRHVQYGPILWRGSGNAWSYEFKIGEDPGDGWVCDHWTVYIGLDFDSPVVETPETSDGLPTDKLTKVELHKLGTCV